MVSTLITAKTTASNLVEHGKQLCCLQFGIIPDLLNGSNISFVIVIPNTDYLSEEWKKVK